MVPGQAVQGVETPVAPCVAVPFEPWPPEKLATVVNECQAHRPWFDDPGWGSGEAERRRLVIAKLSAPDVRVFEVWRGSTLVGIFLIADIVAGRDATFHALFFDRELRDKRALSRNVMRWAFERLPVKVLRIELPTYAAKLLGFMRKALGFRFESEGRPYSWPKDALPLDANVARLGSRRHHAILHNGVWHDTLLLSITDDEFRALPQEVHARSIQRLDESPPSNRT